MTDSDPRPPLKPRAVERQAAAQGIASILPAAAFDPHRLWQLLRRRRFFLILPILVVGITVGVGLRNITPVYISTSAILMEERSTGTNIDRIMITEQAQRNRNRNRLTVVGERFRSQDLMNRVISNLRLREDPGVIAEATYLQQTKLPDQTVSLIAERILVDRLRAKLSVRANGADIYQVSVEDNDPTTAYKLNEAITAAYIDLVARERSDEILDTEQFTDEQLVQARASLDTAEQALQEFKRTMLLREELSGNPVTGKNSQRARNLVRLVRLDIDETDRELDQVRARLRQLEVDSDSSPLILNDGEVRGLTERLVALEREDYLAQLRDNVDTREGISPGRQRIGVQRNRLAARVSQLVDREFPDLSSSQRGQVIALHELTAIRDIFTQHQQVITREYQRFVANVQDQPEQEQELQRLEKEARLADDIVQRLVTAQLQGTTTTSATESGFGTRVRQLEPPKKPLYPAKPNKKKIAVMALMLALGIGAGAVFLAEYVDSSFKDVRDVFRQTGLEVLGTLPRFADEFQWEKKKRRVNMAWRTAFVLTLVTAMTLFVLYYKRSTVQNRIELITQVESTVNESGR